MRVKAGKQAGGGKQWQAATQRQVGKQVEKHGLKQMQAGRGVQAGMQKQSRGRQAGKCRVAGTGGRKRQASRQAEARREEQEFRVLQANTGRQKQAGSGRQEERQAWEVGRHTGMQKQAHREEDRNACGQKQEKKQSLAGRQARTDQKRHLGKQGSRQAAKQPETEAGRQRHLCKISKVKTTRLMQGDRHAAMQTVADN